ncbi:MAG: UbiH/UbiF/VisC/COQ6 family ubiquinone biosynthesis hydroxylase [Alphaproteobacteria bacterium]|nr:UbiH/UbiF/VisC/COQ6 family ubiquinone biosynthesis hydroxylase [Alphaproteobacteria bacterium]
MRAKKFNPDVIIVGGGPAGMTLAALLADQGVKTLSLDREPVARQHDLTQDGRTMAISWGSQKVLDRAGVWEVLAPRACPIEQIDITDGDSPVLLTFQAQETQADAFGWIVDLVLIRKALFARLETLNTAQHITEAAVVDFVREDHQVTVVLEDGRRFSAPLVIGADGRQSRIRDLMGIGTRGWDYNQTALVCTVTHENPHDYIALENFRESGPFAILPMTDTPDGLHRSSVVWAQHIRPGRTPAPMTWDEDTFNAALQARFPARYGRVKFLGKRFCFPLNFVHAHDYVAPRMALIADAAHGMHPIAGQGLNLGYRDVALLGRLIPAAVAAGKDPGADSLLQDYQRARRVDNMAMMGTTDFFVRLFSNAVPPVALARKMGLRAVDRLPFAKRFFMKQAMGDSRFIFQD